MTIPIAVPIKDDNDETTHSELFTLEAPMVEDPVGQGRGEYLPIGLGLETMSCKSAVLEMDKGKQTLALPGPGGYMIEWAPGAKRMALESAMSPHLMANWRVG